MGVPYVVVRLLGWCAGDGLLGVVWFERVMQVGWLMVVPISGVAGVGLVRFVDGRM